MDGAPVFNMVRNNLPGVKILGFTGALNSTSKVVIEAMRRGLTLEDGIAEARALGIAEADPSYDVDGWDSAAKAAALANVFMDANITPQQVDRRGIGQLTPAKLQDMAAKRKTAVLISRATQTACRPETAGPRRGPGRHRSPGLHARHLQHAAVAYRPDGHRRHGVHFSRRGADGLRNFQRPGRYREHIMKLLRFVHDNQDSHRRSHLRRRSAGGGDQCAPRRQHRQRPPDHHPAGQSAGSARPGGNCRPSPGQSEARAALRCAAENLVHRPELQVARRGHSGGSARRAGQFHEARVVPLPARGPDPASARRDQRRCGCRR
jgi:Homoserine dehydrogenase